MTVSDRIKADFIYRLDQFRPVMPFLWLEVDSDDIIQFATGWTFQLQVVTFENVIALTIPDGQIDGTNTSPNVVVNPVANQWTGLEVGWYQLHLGAWQSDGLPMYLNEGFWPTLELTAVPTP
jgi:hypothetical protein